MYAVCRMDRGGGCAKEKKKVIAQRKKTARLSRSAIQEKDATQQLNVQYRCRQSNSMI